MESTESMQDVFISHAGRDKEQYIEPLTEALVAKKVTFWLDDLEIAWGDSITMKINKGIANSKFVLLCLSRAFLRRSWTEAELGAALSIQNSTGTKRILPLILNQKEEVLARYPLLAGLAYREFSTGTSLIADEISNLCRGSSPHEHDGKILLTVESVHTGKLCSIYASPNVSLRWLIDRAKAGMGVTDLADTGAYQAFRVRWVLVDTRAEEKWHELPRYNQRKLCAIIAATEEDDFIYSTSDLDKLDSLGIRDGTIFHIYAIEDERHEPPAASIAR